jgi:hypothetical protein
MVYIQLIEVDIGARAKSGNGDKFCWNYCNCYCFVDDLQQQ